MKASVVFALVGAASLAAGAALYLATRPAAQVAAPEIGPAALYAASFRDPAGESVSLGRFAGRPVVLNFWATWCAPCREEMPVFSRVSTRKAGEVQFVGLSQDDPAKVRDAATFPEPRQQAEGIPYVFVNGVAVIDDSHRTTARPGHAIRRTTS